MTDEPVTPVLRRLLDENGQSVQVIYALPPDLIASSRADDGVDLGRWAERCWRHRRAMALVMVVAVAIGLTIALATTPVFTASVIAMPPAPAGKQPALSQVEGLAALAGIPLPGEKSSAEELVAILKSRRLRARLVEDFSLGAYYRVNLFDDALKAFDRDFSVQYDKKAGTITFSCTHADPARAAEIANRAASELQALFNAIHQSSSRREREFLEKRRADVERDLQMAQERMAAFQRENRAVQIEAQVKATVEAVSVLEGQLIGEQVELRALLASQAASDNPQIQLLQERIKGLSDAIGRLAGDASPAGSPADNVLLQLGSLPELGVRYVNLFREVKKNEAIAQALTTQLETARFNELRSAEAITIIDPAVAPQRRSAPKRSMIVMASLFLGLFLGVGWAVLADPAADWQRRLRAT